MNGRIFAAIFVPIALVAVFLIIVFVVRSRLGISDDYHLDVAVEQLDGEPNLEEYENCVSLLQMDKLKNSNGVRDCDAKAQVLSLNELHAIFPTRQYQELENASDSCVICQEKFNRWNNVCQLACSHVFHTRCIDHWTCENSACCPLCRRSYFMPQDHQSKTKYIQAVLGPTYSQLSSAKKANSWLELYPDLTRDAEARLGSFNSSFWKIVRKLCFVSDESITSVTIINSAHRRYNLINKVENIKLEHMRNELRQAQPTI
ncbi:LANO_0E05534g1_1 [Lachancea nothofagi CBS 11611]|uniref:LANO_0E05534g1_1 n=1 Tax=Lachancea nothofagi CBS 11611 TaxID=1266666 RepID=A0A1G4JT68_9SACH|nr:LANO_0E05534g1_1 [Lachancea nothofagi CBS 11611]